MKQVLCVWFPNWSIQRTVVARPELKGRSVVLHSPIENRKPMVTACSSQAANRGVCVGMPLAEARTLAPSGCFIIDSPAADDEQLRRLAWDCQQFTSRAGLEETIPPESLFLDVTGCVQQFGSIQQLGENVVESFQTQGYRVRVATAPTFGAAWAVSHTAKGTNFTVLKEEEIQETFSQLPVWSLRLPDETLSLLEECGIKTIGQLMKLSRSSLPSRFGSELLMRLDQALGNVEEILKLELPPQPICAESQFEFSLQDTSELSAALQPLLRNVLAELKRCHRETQHLRMTWKTEEGKCDGFDIRLLRPTAAVNRFEELLSLHLERQRFTGGIVSLRAEIIPCSAETIQRLTLFDRDDEDQEAEFLHLIERLSSRLGPQAVGHSRLLPEAQPELAVVVEPWLSGERKSADRKLVEPTAQTHSHRPFRLLAKPVSVAAIVDEASGLPYQFHWQDKDYTVVLCEGPERIETGWWRAVMVRRSYYRVETHTGARFWLFHDVARENWFVQGLFD